MEHPGELVLHERRIAPAIDATIASAEAGAHEIRRELYRSRRYSRTFALVGHPLRSDDQPRALRTALRRLDYVWIAGGQIYILLPEADRTTVDGLLSRLRTIDESLIDVAEARVAVFPQDALTEDALTTAVAVPRAALDGGTAESVPPERIDAAPLGRLLRRVSRRRDIVTAPSQVHSA